MQANIYTEEHVMISCLCDALEEQVKDLYNAENQLVKALPKMAKAASNPSLRMAFENHLEETKQHVARLEEVAELMEIKPTGKTCRAMQGLIEEGKEVLEEDGENSVIDAMLIGAAQRIEHYEIAAYGTARELAKSAGKDNLVELFQRTLDEEGEADKKLTSISMDEVLPAAAETEEHAEK